MSIGPPQASSMRTSRSDGKSRRSPAAARAAERASSVNAGSDPTAEPGPPAAAADGDPPVVGRPQVVQREPGVRHALAAGPADLRETVRDGLGEDDVARPGHQPPPERRPGRGPGVHGHDRRPGEHLAVAGR